MHFLSSRDMQEVATRGQVKKTWLTFVIRGELRKLNGRRHRDQWCNCKYSYKDSTSNSAATVVKLAFPPLMNCEAKALLENPPEDKVNTIPPVFP